MKIDDIIGLVCLCLIGIGAFGLIAAMGLADLNVITQLQGRNWAGISILVMMVSMFPTVLPTKRH